MSLRVFARALAAREVAGADVVADEIARPHVEVLEVQRVPAGHRRRALRNAERHDLLRAAAHRVHEIERRDAEVVLGLGLDVDFLEQRDATIARGLHDMHFRRTILERADEVFGVAAARQTFGVGKRDAIGIVLDDLQRAA